jgi:hypothetical protein
MVGMAAAIRDEGEREETLVANERALAIFIEYCDRREEESTTMWILDMQRVEVVDQCCDPIGGKRARRD